MKNSIIPFLLLSFLLVGCSEFTEKKAKSPDYPYIVTDSAVYYRYLNNGNFKWKEVLVKDADPKTFTKIPNSVNLLLGKDHKHVYRRGLIMEGADPGSFEQIKEYFFKDKDHVFLLRFGDYMYIIPDADPNTFMVFEDFLWGKDRNAVFYSFDKLQDVDPETFVAVDEEWGRDDRFYYYHNLRVDSLDYHSAKVVSNYYIKDKDHLFFKDLLVKDANPHTFKAHGKASSGYDDKYMFDDEKNKGPITEEYRKRYKIKR